MKHVPEKLEGIAIADCYLTNLGLPSYLELASAASALACSPDSISARNELNRLLDLIPNESNEPGELLTHVIQSDRTGLFYTGSETGDKWTDNMYAAKRYIESEASDIARLICGYPYKVAA